MALLGRMRGRCLHGGPCTPEPRGSSRAVPFSLSKWVLLTLKHLLRNKRLLGGSYNLDVGSQADWSDMHFDKRGIGRLFAGILMAACVVVTIAGYSAHVGYEQCETDAKGVENTKNIKFESAYCVGDSSSGEDSVLYVFFDVMADEKENLELPVDGTSQQLGAVTLETSNGNKYYDRGGKSQESFRVMGYSNTLGGDELSAGSGKTIHYCSVFEGVAPADLADEVTFDYKIAYSPKAQKMVIPRSAIEQAESYDDIATRIPKVE